MKDNRVFYVLLIIALLNFMMLVSLFKMEGPTECHMTSMTSQVCEYR